MPRSITAASPPLHSLPIIGPMTGACPKVHAVGSVYYVAPYGDDANPGTFEQPWRTIGHAADVAGPGDTVYIRGGTYIEEVTFSHSGDADSPITFAANPGEAVTVQGSLTLAQGTSHLHLRGFAVTGYSIWGVTLLGDNRDVLLSGLDVSGGEAGVHFTVGYSGQPPLYGPVEDVTLEDSRIHDVLYTAVDCTPGPCNRMTFRRLEIYGAGLVGGASFGADGLAVERGHDILVEDCIIHDNGGDGIDLNSRDQEGNIPDILVRRNLVYRNHLQGVKLWAGGRMENNAIWGQGINPVVVGVYTGTFEVVNNTIAYNMWDPEYSVRDYAFVAAYPEIGFSPAVSLTLVNNIFAFNTGPQVGSPTGLYLGEGVRLTEHHNLYFSREDGEIYAAFAPEHNDGWFSRQDIADGTWTAVTGQGQGNVIGTPLFTSDWPEVDLHLGEGSPAIDAGSAEGAPDDDLAGHPRPVGAGYDMGAYEYRGSGVVLYLPMVIE